MGLFDKLFGQKPDNQQQPTPSPTPEPTRQTMSEEARVKILKSIYPYFKQFNPSKGESVELPADLKDVDKSKVYHTTQIQLVMREVCADLTCLYAIDNEYGYEIIQENKMKELRLTKEQLHDIALNNFRELISTKMKGHGSTNGIMFTVNGNLEAGLVLIDEIWDQLESQIGEEVVVAVPARDVVVATGKSNRAMIDSFREKAVSILEGGDHPLSRNWFIWKNRKWEVFEPIVK